jgi:hypothetical protein
MAAMHAWTYFFAAKPDAGPEAGDAFPVYVLTTISPSVASSATQIVKVLETTPWTIHVGP